MKKLKCENCGANLILDSKKEYGFCEYCQTNYRLNNETKNNQMNIKLNSNVNTKAAKSVMIIAVIMMIFISTTIIVTTFMIIFGTKTIFNGINDFYNDNEINSFNEGFEMYKDTSSTYFTTYLLDYIIQSNKISDKKVELVYNSKTYIEEEDINKIKEELKDKEYEVDFEHDEYGFIKKVIINN